MYKIEFYVPENYLEVVKDALFDNGAGIIGDYEKCCWQIEGRGQFQPGNNSNPHIGEIGELEILKEWKVEMVCSVQNIKTALAAFLEAHPYEEPAYNIVEFLDKNMFL